jgi:hypothetical protein
MNLISFGGIPPYFIKNLSRRADLRRILSAARRKNAEFSSAAAAHEIWVGARPPPAGADRLRALCITGKY